jgi:NAD(P)-dependent dehydrogenase (short-subunit alcohol dehydrogenase family)
MSASSLVVVITGSNKGIGLALVAAYAKKGSKVYASCRTASPELKAIAGVHVVEGIDVATDDGAAKLASCLESESRIDILINNAAGGATAVVTAKEFPHVFRNAVEVNTLGPLRIMTAVAPAVYRGGTAHIYIGLMVRTEQ